METLLDEIAQKVAMSSSGLALVECEMSERMKCAEDLQCELYCQDEVEDESDVQIITLGVNPDDIALISDMPNNKICIVVCDADSIGATAKSLEASRGRFVLGPRIVIVTGPNGGEALAQAAPNIWSWVGGRQWQNIRRTPPFNKETRLDSLRMATGFTDQQIIIAAEERTLNSDPVFAEWLSLLGRGDLLGN